MPAFPAAGYIGGDTRTEAEIETALEDWLAATKQLPGAAAETELTIASGAVTPTAATHAIDTESDAATDDLDTINQTNIPDGGLCLFHSADNARVPTVRYNQGGTGKVLLADAANLALANTGIWLLLQRKGTTWEERGRFYGASSALARAFLGLGKETLAKSSTYTVVAADRSKLINCSATLTLNLTAAATLGDGFEIEVVNSSASGVVTIDPNSSETIDGVTTVTLAAGEACLLRCNGAAWQSIARPGRIGLMQGRQTIYVPAAAMVPRTTNGAAAGSFETSTNKVMRETLDFDQTTQEFAQFSIAMPKSWNLGTVTARFLWTASAGSGTAVWGLQGVALSDDDAFDAAFGTAQEVADAMIALGDLHRTAETAAITIAGTPAAEDLVVFQVYRDPADASDNLSGDARLVGVVLYVTLNAPSDA